MQFGLEYDVNESFVACAGSAYSKNPVSAAIALPAFPAFVEHHFTLSASFAATNAISIHAARQMALNNAQTAMRIV